ncbi:hypothetical protein GLOIN_2v1593234 [Rhizophagus irregularis DAOM 181602=DAOM 197198]|uniref:Uncharacterized protein n=1 Tax=Rhizophagus irregularis (strain DAOM 181602 / DAOM 197198 / MUCL 43194) TaxID=747089 RepID=A0A2P4Q516_RHIID|nr:hypothetical protein GLOIN_2v1593234 [Rhizophagus irregularis DAOM 181602=DAOM 197198]POG72745.1 hypothetical protein GLOIN_2v1593234 [Rhizophagus irregularis DAOM 181602=DAOM 197198]|eukprot:XP_025179611.1 hypothetical protein GLOIN_2v1593234 [Rhizophagus irregularis DAOM 181602=DAOM 197198]
MDNNCYICEGFLFISNLYLQNGYEKKIFTLFPVYILIIVIRFIPIMINNLQMLWIY